MADLVFSRARYAGGPVDLVFGATDAPPAPDPVYVHATVVLAPIGVTGLAFYDNRNPRRATTSAALPFQPGVARALETAMPWGLSARHLGGTDSPWQTAKPASNETTSPWVVSTRLRAERSVPWALGAAAETTAALVHQVAAQLRAAAVSAPWQQAQARAVQAALVHQAARSHVRQAVAPWELAARMQALATARWGSGVARAVELRAPWEIGRPVPPGREVWPVIIEPPFPPRVPSTHLVFACPPWAGGPVHLVFGHVCGLPPGPQAPVYILPARFYMAVHTLIAHRLPDLTELSIFDVSLSADSGSFAWTFSASGPISLFDALAPDAGLPAQIRITLDGMPFVFAVDSLQREERFGKRGVRISGRSATALLARPYARETTRLSSSPATAQQLALAALEFTGVDLDWGLTDWLVPAGAWSHLGTPLGAVQAIVEAAGGYLQSHRSAATLLARHPYPELPGGVPGGPWNWGGAFAVDVELALDALITQAIERRDGPDINGVYVSGTNAGVLALVKRSGSAADKLASLVTDPLITASEAAMQRGLSVLGAAGAKHLVQIDLPILTGAGQPGVLDVGQLVQINAISPWRGRVRSVSVNAAMPKARQTVGLERHLEEV